MAKKKTTKTRTATPGTAGKKKKSAATTAKRTPRIASAKGKHLVIVESPTKAKTINKYLGSDYLVMASVGHVRDLPAKAPKGVKQLVPGVDLENDFAPTYAILPTKKKTVADLKRAADQADDVWFATDLDREGEAIAWHLAEALGVPTNSVKRVVFNAITKAEIHRAFDHPRTIDANKVNAQQARRILDRIVGYQVSPFLWKKVAGGLSAGRVQSVAVRLVVKREREIEVFVPDEEWTITGYFALEEEDGGKLGPAWTAFLVQKDDKGNAPTLRAQNAWLTEARALRAELVEFDGEKFEPAIRVDQIIGPLDNLSPDAIRARLEQAAKAFEERGAHDLTPNVAHVAGECGLRDVRIEVREDADGRGPARWPRTIQGVTDPKTPGIVESIETKRTKSWPSPPFITSTLQQTGLNVLGFNLKRTMRVAQQLYEGIDIRGEEGQTGLITYMRTDSTHLSAESLNMARSYITSAWGPKYLPHKPNFYKSSNRAAQEAHEAIRPTDVSITPKRLRNELTEEQYRLYRLIWERFLACQMLPAEWDLTTVLIKSHGQGGNSAVFKTSGRTLVFDGFYKATGVPKTETLNLPSLEKGQPLAAFHIDPRQHFTSPPPRYTEASLQKKLEEEGIGRPSTYAPIIQTIQDRKYVQPLTPRDKRLAATDLGMVVTDMLAEAFPKVMDVAYTRDMEAELDKIEEEQHDWVAMLHAFYDPFKKNLEAAHQQTIHAKAVQEPAPYKCATCGATTVYRFGRNGRFLSCSRYPDCKYAAPIDREGKPVAPEQTDILCPLDNTPMIKRTGRFGPFLASANYPEVKFILKLDPQKHTICLPKTPPLLTDLTCPKCDSPLNLRRSKRGPWLSCSTFPKCRGRLGWTTLDPKQQQQLEDALAKHEADHPQPVIYNSAGQIIDENYIPRIADEGTTSDNARDSDAA